MLWGSGSRLSLSFRVLASEFRVYSIRLIRQDRVVVFNVQGLGFMVKLSLHSSVMVNHGFGSSVRAQSS